jgi:hypothetical protein
MFSCSRLGCLGRGRPARRLSLWRVCQGRSRFRLKFSDLVRSLCPVVVLSASDSILPIFERPSILNLLAQEKLATSVPSKSGTWATRSGEPDARQRRPPTPPPAARTRPRAAHQPETLYAIEPYVPHVSTTSATAQRVVRANSPRRHRARIGPSTAFPPQPIRAPARHPVVVQTHRCTPRRRKTASSRAHRSDVQRAELQRAELQRADVSPSCRRAAPLNDENARTPRPAPCALKPAACALNPAACSPREGDIPSRLASPCSGQGADELRTRALGARIA